MAKQIGNQFDQSLQICGPMTANSVLAVNQKGMHAEWVKVDQKNAMATLSPLLTELLFVPGRDKDFIHLDGDQTHFNIDGVSMFDKVSTLYTAKQDVTCGGFKISGQAILDMAGYKLRVRNVLRIEGQTSIRARGLAGGSASGSSAGPGGAGSPVGTLGGGMNGGNGGAGRTGTNQAGFNGVSGVASLFYSKSDVAGVGGDGGPGGNVGGTGGAAGTFNASRATIEGLVAGHYVFAEPINGSPTLLQGGPGGGGGASGGSAVTADSGAGGGGGGGGGIISIACYELSVGSDWTGAILATGGNGGNGGNSGAPGNAGRGGGGGGGAGGVIIINCVLASGKTLVLDKTRGLTGKVSGTNVNVRGGTGGAAGSGGGGGGTAGTNGLDGIAILVIANSAFTVHGIASSAMRTTATEDYVADYHDEFDYSTESRFGYSQVA